MIVATDRVIHDWQDNGGAIWSRMRVCSVEAEAALDGENYTNVLVLKESGNISTRGLASENELVKKLILDAPNNIKRIKELEEQVEALTKELAHSLSADEVKKLMDAAVAEASLDRELILEFRVDSEQVLNTSLKVQVIKAIRQLTHWGLRESKDATENDMLHRVTVTVSRLNACLAELNPYTVALAGVLHITELDPIRLAPIKRHFR